ncbi:hypothetical protein NGM10_04080 [Halorussus salilacus]|uniref:hypothetical protein n=1 Tax=Halorussus salilacus TaxID=2953750 RepID=UPI0020A146EE|nr:hypothetical protein [Halorussus salilacus]USZ68919.1 hypothetical protein NGM10_04080 [Halorussus salilacus]
MTDADDWERVARQTAAHSLDCLLDDAAATVEPVANTLYWSDDLSPEQIDAMRQLAFELEYVTEEYLARLCEETTPWNDDAERVVSRLPDAPTADGPETSGDPETSDYS